MAPLLPSSVLLLVALLSWNVHCFPTKGWTQRASRDGSLSNIKTPPVLYRSSQGASAQSADDGPESFLHEPVKKGAYSSPKRNLASSRLPPFEVYEAPGLEPVEESPAALRVSRTYQPTSDGGFPPPQAGELQNYDESIEDGDREEETEDLVPPPPPPYLGSPFKAGELKNYLSSYEHGDYEEETESQDSAPLPYVEPASYVSNGGQVPFQPNYPWTREDYAYYLFFTGGLPAGTLSHYSSDYEAGRDYYDDAEYERYDYPPEDPATPEDPPAQDPVTYQKLY
ncbi:uncharacterized protein LOC131474122 [Solea solea]|uniref:uncharacterized protein LOC131474122 n=1 Tax=Solea solea TaxID=90069 RepID=UPI00272B06F2|nr:uncharacterized protein LOC131474122 [Solea solea]